MELVCLTLPYARCPFERALEGIARAGYTAVAVGWAHQGEDPLGVDPAGEPVRRCRELCAQHGLRPAVVGGRPTVSGLDRSEQLLRRIDVAQALGVPLVQSQGAGRYRRFPSEPLDPAVFWAAHRAYVAEMREVGRYAAAAGVTVAIKPHTGNTATAAHQRRTLAEIGSQAVKASYDPGNIHFYEGQAPEDDFHLIAGDTVSIVAKDHRGARAERNFPIPGEGDIDWRRIFMTARSAGFSGSILVERIDGTKGDRSPEEIDARLTRARTYLAELLEDIGYTEG